MGDKPKFLVVETNLHYQTNAGDELVFNLDIPFGVLRKAGEESDTDEQQFMATLRLMGATDILETLDKMGSLEVVPLISRFFEEYEALAEVKVGEAKRSSKK